MNPCKRSLLWIGSVCVNPVVYPLVGGDLQKQKHNLQLIGGTGAGKAHLAIPLGRNAVRRGK
uniref:ATP-binding protein n=1 Tax=Aeromonas hydrophila TaxID=644 RepID=UPI001C5E62E4